MFKATDPNKQIEWTSKLDTDEPKSLFYFGAISADDLEKISFMGLRVTNLDKKAETSVNITDLPAKNKIAIQLGLKGWENFMNQKFATEEKDIPGIGKRAVITDELYAKIPGDLRIEMAAAIENVNSLKPADEKNS